MEDYEIARSKLLDSMKTTVRSRFKAHRRLILSDQKLTQTIALSSCVVIIASFITYILKSPPIIADMINLLSACLSLVILIASLLQYSSQNATIAEQHHRSALEINGLLREHETNNNITDLDYEKLCKDYEFVLHKYSVNHEEIDYHNVLIERRHENQWLTDDVVKEYKKDELLENWKRNSWLGVVALIFLVIFGFATIGPSFVEKISTQEGCSRVEHVPRP